ncbi:hypothetical protein DQW50_16360 [Halorubrum sp. 48-1-W]|uniref:hypothetical protein n=1 Tax=Halorubrum sp. 48-1-W TaxID=2249761 RepID=UPI000DCD11B2|nr:hypothetical protein [Halorubrum sp. 48-1-W]RAW44094.1 hypothetical protein DQW50_16360 [Halorubrum sp. 48-1-W]
MRLPIFLVLFSSALLGTAGALRLATTVRDRQGIQYAVGLSAGCVVLWLLVTISAFNLVSVSGGSEFTHSYPSLGVLGVLGVGVSILVLTKGSVELLGN